MECIGIAKFNYDKRSVALKLYNKEVFDEKGENCTESDTFEMDLKTLKLLYASSFDNITYNCVNDTFYKIINAQKKEKYPYTYMAKYKPNKDIVAVPHKRDRELFPLPSKAMLYVKKRAYVNISSFFSKDIMTVLEASVLCSYLNQLAINEQILSQKLFEHSCGRVFMDTELLKSSLWGRKFLKSYYPTALKKNGWMPTLVKSAKLKRGRDKEFKKNFDVGSKKATILNVHRRFITDVSLLGICIDENLFLRGEEVFEFVKNEIDLLGDFFANIVWNGGVEKLNDFRYADIEDVLSCHLFEGWDKLRNNISENRFFYNVWKDKKIDLIF